MLTTWEQEYLETPDEVLDEIEFKRTHDCGMCGRTGMVYDGYFKCRHDGAWYPCDENHAEPGCWAGRR